MPIKEVFVFEWSDLLRWRRERNLKAYELAKMIGVSRNTVSRWERGHVPLPVWLHSKLEELAFTLAPKPVAPIPERLNRESAALRPDLDLYGPKTRNGVGGFGSEHPAVLLPDLLPRKAGVHRIAWSVLESEEYITALGIKRHGEK